MKRPKFSPDRGRGNGGPPLNPSPSATQRPTRTLNYKQVHDLVDLPSDQLCFTLACESFGFLALLDRVGSARQPLSPRFLFAVLAALEKALDVLGERGSEREDAADGVEYAAATEQSSDGARLLPLVPHPIRHCDYGETKSKLISALFQSQFLPTALKQFCDQYASLED